jgi:16S rRNA (uracil1498-N3)-methyltransferase
MAGHRFFLTPSSFAGGDRIRFNEAIAHQVRNVLRLRPGMRVTALDDAGLEYEVELVTVERDAVVGQVVTSRPARGEPGVAVTLYQSLLKGDRFEWVLQKGTEIGVAAFVPVISERTVRREAEQVEKKRARWERIIREAAEQSGRGRLPCLGPALDVDEVCAQAGSEADLALMPWEEAEGLGLLTAVWNANPRPRRVALLIGPEGGFAAHEVAAARQAGILVVTLGTRILRAETAGVVAAAIALAGLGEMGGNGA